MSNTVSGQLVEAIQTVVKRIKEFNDSHSHICEENTKAALIDPILVALGWDVHDPDQVDHECRPTSAENPVDYALKLSKQSKPMLLLEAKALGKGLDDRKWLNQVLGYAYSGGVKWCVLSDGDQYRFYNAFAVAAEDKLFINISLSASAARPLEAAQVLSIISRETLNEDVLERLWQINSADRDVRAAIRAIMDEPDEGFVRIIRKRFPLLEPKTIAASLARLKITIETVPPPKPEVNGPEDGPISIKSLIEAGLLLPPIKMSCEFREQTLEAEIQPDGRILFDGQIFKTPSGAGAAAKKKICGTAMPTSGWDFWLVKTPDGKLQPLSVIRDAAPKVR